MTKQGGRATGQRHLRVGETLRQALAALFARGDFRDPDLGHAAITVTEVRVTPDLRHATVFIMPLGGANAEPVLRGLQRCTPYLRGQLARQVSLRYMPNLMFAFDHTFDYAERIDDLLRRAEGAHDSGDESAAEKEDHDVH